MIGTDITVSQGAVHTPGLRDPYPVQGCLGDHTQETDDHPSREGASKQKNQNGKY